MILHVLRNYLHTFKPIYVFGLECVYVVLVEFSFETHDLQLINIKWTPETGLVDMYLVINSWEMGAFWWIFIKGTLKHSTSGAAIKILHHTYNLGFVTSSLRIDLTPLLLSDSNKILTVYSHICQEQFL